MLKILRIPLLIALTIFWTSIAFSQEEAEPIDLYGDTDRLPWLELEAEFGSAPDFSDSDIQAGIVIKTLTSEYWSLMAEGYERAADNFGIEIILQAADNETDADAQLAIAQAQLLQQPNILLVSPQTDTNLDPIVGTATALEIPIVGVDALMTAAGYYVGPLHSEAGIVAAQWFLDNRPDGGQIAIIEGQEESDSAFRRTNGFTETLEANSDAFEIVASLPGDWNRQIAFEQASQIIRDNPDIMGFYANNDTMALGVMDAVQVAGLQDQIAIIGTDGIGEAYDAILAGDMDGTVDIFPSFTGEIALEVALRLLDGQELPRIIWTAQAVVTAENYERYYGEDADLRAALLEDAEMAIDSE